MKNKCLHYFDPLYELLLFKDAALSKVARGELNSNSNIDKSIVPLINCPEVARLRWLNQAGFLSMIYPSGTHNRFAHSLGSVHLGMIALNSVTIETIEKGNGTRDGADNTDVTVTRTLIEELSTLELIEEFLAALFLHDLGHMPYSHTIEKNLGIRKALGYHITHEEIGCQLILGEGEIFEAYKAKFENYGNERNSLVSNVLKRDNYDKNVICYLISGDEKYISEDKTKELIKRSGNKHHVFELLKVLHNLVSGTYDLDRIDHYRRDSFFTGKGHSFKPLVLLDGLHYLFKENIMTQADIGKEAEEQITTLIFIRNQLHKYCFEDSRNIAYGAMLNHALVLHLESITDKVKKKEVALKILSMNDAELLLHLQNDNKCKELIEDIFKAKPYPCRATFGKTPGLDSEEIVQKVLDESEDIILGFSKYYDSRNSTWLTSDSTPMIFENHVGYAFSKTIGSPALISTLRNISFSSKRKLNSVSETVTNSNGYCD